MTPANEKTSRNQKAFTLIELLVVIAIISLLVSILLPSLQKAKELTKITMCATQLRGLGMAINTYAEENKGFYYPTARGDRKSPEVVHPNLIYWIRYYDCPPSMFYCPFKPFEPVNSQEREEEFHILYTWYRLIGYTYLACYEDAYDSWFKNGYHSPQKLETAESDWALMTDLCRDIDGWQTNHWFDGGENISNNVLFVDIHVENRSKDMEANFDAGGGYQIWW